MHNWNNLPDHFKAKFGQRVQKIPLDAGASCPNRQGSHTGCTFCNAKGAGSGLLGEGLSLSQQWNHWLNHFATSNKAQLFMAYLQSFSNTYGPIDRLAAVLDELKTLQKIVGLSVGTRPDCLDAPKLALLASCPWPEIWLELGVQTMHNASLDRIHRGHTMQDSCQAIQMSSAAGLLVCSHVMFGLPGENRQDMLETVRQLNDLPIHGIKFHNVYVCQDTKLAKEFLAGDYTPLTSPEYIDLVSEALCLLRKDIVVHRIVADPEPQELLAPDWAVQKSYLVRAIQHNYHRKINLKLTEPN